MNFLTIMSINKHAIMYAFKQVAKNYDNITLFQHQSVYHLFDRLTIIAENIILDVGGNTDYFSKQWYLVKKHGFVFVLSTSMLAIAQQKQVVKSYIQADIEFLPLTNQSVSYRFGHFAIQWLNNLYTPLHDLLSELYSFTKKVGIVTFSILIDGLLEELQQFWRKFCHNRHINYFITYQYIKQTCYGWLYSFKKYCWYVTYQLVYGILYRE